MPATKRMFVVQITNNTHPSFGQYYGGYNAVTKTPFYVKRISRAKLYSNVKEIFLRPHDESIVPVTMKVTDECFQVSGEAVKCNTAEQIHMVSTTDGAQLAAPSYRNQTNKGYNEQFRSMGVSDNSIDGGPRKHTEH